MIDIDKRIAALMCEFKKNVDEDGFAILSTSRFSYTVGMAKHGLPEIILSSPDVRFSIHLAELVAKVFIYEGKYAGGVLTDVVPLKGGGFLSLDVGPVQVDGILIDSYIVQAGNFYRSYPKYQVKPMSVCQVLWTDFNGAFPYDAGYDFNQCPQYIFKDVDHD